MARKARPVAVAKAPKARAADESSSPVFGRAWLPCLCLGSLTSEDDAEVVIETDNDMLALADSLIEVETLVEVLADSLSDVDSLSDTEALVDSEALIEPETVWLAEIEALVLDDSLSDVDSLVETEALVLCDSETDVEID